MAKGPEPIATGSISGHAGQKDHRDGSARDANGWEWGPGPDTAVATKEIAASSCGQLARAGERRRSPGAMPLAPRGRAPQAQSPGSSHPSRLREPPWAEALRCQSRQRGDRSFVRPTACGCAVAMRARGSLMGTTMGRAAFLAPLGNWRAERLPLRTELSRLLVEWLGASLGAEAQAAAQGVMRRLGPCLREAPRVRSAARRGEPPARSRASESAVCAGGN